MADHSPHLKALATIVGDDAVRVSETDLKTYGDDWTHRFEPKPLAIVFPASTEQVSRVIRYCHEHTLAVVPSGGRTGLAAAAVATQGEIVLSMDRMNRVEEINVEGLYARVEAGVVTENLQNAARDHGLYYPADLAAKGSCQIGGNIACNAGGLHVIRYGTLHDIVLGLEVVLANGDILPMNKALRKDNTGYDLKHLFLASEGTLGVITRATVRLVPKPRPTTLVCLALDAFDRIPTILKKVNTGGMTPLSFEFFSREALAHVLHHNPTLRPPFTDSHAQHLLIETEEGAAGSFGTMETFIEQLFHEGLVSDGILAQSSTERRDVWALRESISESVQASGPVRKCDISVAINTLPALVAELAALATTVTATIEVIIYGHIGDGNVHVNLLSRQGVSPEAFLAAAKPLEARLFTFLRDHGGSMSAEHGIGLLKKGDLHYSRTPREIELMRSIKKVFDPKGIMNPGKVFDLV